MLPTRTNESSTVSTHSKGRPSKRRRISSQSRPSRSNSPASPPEPKVPKRGISDSGTLYDAVAGRLTDHGFRNNLTHFVPSYGRDTVSHSLAPITATEALLASRNAPDLGKDDDLFNMHRELFGPSLRPKEAATGHARSDPSNLQSRMLPSSDLLKAVHAYSSDFYAATSRDRGRYDWKSMDETALLAIGILMEEEVTRLLGENGWTVFIEQEEKSGRSMETNDAREVDGQGRNEEQSHRDTQLQSDENGGSETSEESNETNESDMS